MEYQNVKSLEINVRRSLLLYAHSNRISHNGVPTLEDGIERIFTYRSNNLRMAEKSKEIEKTQFLDLIAHSGYSFVANYGNRYRWIVEQHLQSGKPFRIIIENPWTFDVLLQVFSEKRPDSINQYSVNSVGIKTFYDPINIIKDSQWYRIKFADSINGFLSLREKYGDRIQLRISKYEIPSSILITSSSCFIEPYLSIGTFERQNQGMLLFEAKISEKSSIYKYVSSYFNFVWEISETYEVFQKMRISLKNLY